MTSTSSASGHLHESRDDAPRRSWVNCALLSLALLVLVALPTAIVSKRLYEARQLERIATAGGCEGRWGWRHYDTWYDSPTMRRIAGDALILCREDQWLGGPDSDEHWLAVSRQLRPYVHRVYGINFRRTTVTGRSLDDLAAYPGLVQLLLYETNVSDEDLDVLAELRQIEYLMLSSKVFTDASLDHLSQLPELKYLYVHANQLTPDGIETLSHLTQLQQLTVSGVTDAGPSRTDLATLNPSLQIELRAD